VLLYYPIYDRFSAPGKEMIEHFDGVGKPWDSTTFKRAAETMLEKGYSFDYISDKQIENILVNGGALQTEGKSIYKTLVIPRCQYIPISTFQKLIALAGQGANVIALEGLPNSVAGFGNHKANQTRFNELISKINTNQDVARRIKEVNTGKGRILIGDSLDELLAYASIQKESLIELGIDFIRKKESGNRRLYFISNRNNKTWEGWLPLQVDANFAVLYDPMTGEFGKAKVRKNETGRLEVFAMLTLQQTLFIETYESSSYP
jgi:hypothetical protein